MLTLCIRQRIIAQPQPRQSPHTAVTEVLSNRASPPHPIASGKLDGKAPVNGTNTPDQIGSPGLKTGVPDDSEQERDLSEGQFRSPNYPRPHERTSDCGPFGELHSSIGEQSAPNVCPAPVPSSSQSHSLPQVRKAQSPKRDEPSRVQQQEHIWPGKPIFERGYHPEEAPQASLATKAGPDRRVETHHHPNPPANLTYIQHQIVQHNASNNHSMPTPPQQQREYANPLNPQIQHQDVGMLSRRHDHAPNEQFPTVDGREDVPMPDAHQHQLNVGPSLPRATAPSNLGPQERRLQTTQAGAIPQSRLPTLQQSLIVVGAILEGQARKAATTDRATLGSLHAKIGELQQSRTELVHELDDTKNRYSQREESLRKELNMLTASNATLQKFLNGHVKDLEKFRREQNKRLEEQRPHKDQIEKLVGQRSELQRKAEGFHAEIQALKQSNITDRNNFSATAARLQQETALLETRLQEAVQQRDALQERHVQLEDRFQKQAGEARIFKEQITLVQPALVEKLDQVKSAVDCIVSSKIKEDVQHILRSLQAIQSTNRTFPDKIEDMQEQVAS
jgi:hypothetical protein